MMLVQAVILYNEQRCFNNNIVPTPKRKGTMVNKWLIYSATYSTYTLIHSVRTCWASLKTVFTDEPYEFSEKYLGILDMVVLFTIAVLLNIFGGQVERYSRRKLIFAIIIGLILDLFILFMLVVKQVTNRALYFFFYMLVGILSCLSWPICLYTVSQYFDSTHATALSMFSSVSQCGDFLAFLITLIVLLNKQTSPAYSLLAIMIMLTVVCAWNYFFFRQKSVNVEQVSVHVNQIKTDMKDSEPASNAPNKGPKLQIKKQQQQQNQRSNKRQMQEENQNGGEGQLEQEIEEPENQRHGSVQMQAEKHKSVTSERLSHNEADKQAGPIQSAPAQFSSMAEPHHEEQPPPVTFLTVWLLPGVALPVLAYSTTKSINAIIVSWLVLYFNKIDMVGESRLIAIVWTFSIVLGGFVAAKANEDLSYKFYVVTLFIAGFVFYMLEGMHVHSNQLAIISLIAICGVLVGIPYNQLGSSVPLKLSESPEIRSLPLAKPTIISLMESVAQVVSGLSILIIPSIGVMKLHYMAGGLCFGAVVLLVGEEVRLYIKQRGIEDMQIKSSQMDRAKKMEEVVVEPELKEDS